MIRVHFVPSECLLLGAPCLGTVLLHLIHRDLHTGHRHTAPIPLHFCPSPPEKSPICLPLYSCLCLSLSPFLFYFEYIFVFFPPSSLSGDRERVFYLAEVRKVESIPLLTLSLGTPSPKSGRLELQRPVANFGLHGRTGIPKELS